MAAAAGVRAKGKHVHVKVFLSLQTQPPASFSLPPILLLKPPATIYPLPLPCWCLQPSLVWVTLLLLTSILKVETTSPPPPIPLLPSFLPSSSPDPPSPTSTGTFPPCSSSSPQPSPNPAPLPYLWPAMDLPFTLACFSPVTTTPFTLPSALSSTQLTPSNSGLAQLSSAPSPSTALAQLSPTRPWPSPDSFPSLGPLQPSLVHSPAMSRPCPAPFPSPRPLLTPDLARPPPRFASRGAERLRHRVPRDVNASPTRPAPPL